MELANDVGARYAGDGQELPGAGECGPAEESPDRFAGGSLAAIEFDVQTSTVDI